MLVLQFFKLSCLLQNEKYKSLCITVFRFEIQKKLKKAKAAQSKKAKPSDVMPSVSERSKERRKDIEQRKDNKKTSAFEVLKAKREQQKQKGKLAMILFCFS